MTDLLEVNIKRGCLMERDSSRESFEFSRDVICSIRRRNIVNKLALVVFQRIMNPSFISLDMFDV